MSSKSESLDIEEKIEHLSNRNRSSGKDGFYVKKKLVYFLGIFIPLLFAGSILATYFGKPDNATKNTLSNIIYLFVCFFEGFYLKCYITLNLT